MNFIVQVFAYDSGKLVLYFFLLNAVIENTDNHSLSSLFFTGYLSADTATPQNSSFVYLEVKAFTRILFGLR